MGGAVNLENLMMLIEEAKVPDEVLPLGAFKAHLRWARDLPKVICRNLC